MVNTTTHNRYSKLRTIAPIKTKHRRNQTMFQSWGGGAKLVDSRTLFANTTMYHEQQHRSPKISAAGFKQDNIMALR